MRCPDCGARNVDGATWCTQCYHRFDAAPAAPAAPAGIVPAPDVPPPADPAGPRAGTNLDAGLSTARDVRDRDGVIEWRCSRCDGWAPLEAATCPSCGSERTGFGPVTRTHRPTTGAPVLAASLALPGLGHLLAGRTGSGVARLGLTLLWLGGGLAILLGGTTGIARLPGLALLLGVAALWAGTVADARQLEAGRGRELLDGRALLWLVVAVTVGLIVALFIATAVGVSG